MRRALVGAALAALAALPILWWAEAGGWLPGPALAAVLLGAGAGWWLDRRLLRPLRRLRHDLDAAGTASAAARAAGGAAAPVTGLAVSLDRVAAAVRGEIAALEEERGDLQEVLASMSDGVLVADAKARVELLNPAFRGLFEVRPELGRGQSVLEITRSPTLAGFLDLLRESGGDAAERRIDNEAGRSLQLRGRRLPGGRLVVVARDLSEQLRLDETRRDLVANVSHELRTPLSAIRGYAENLRDGALERPEVAGRFVGRVLAQCRRLEALLEDLLALSRLETEQIAAPPAGSVDLGLLAERALETVQGLAAEKGVRLELRSGPLPGMAGDEEALERMLLNLLENAIKYNREDGSVALALAPGEREILVEVADTGIGIPQRDLPRIFERFYRVDQGRSREEGGTGLGLAIVKHAAQLHGGRVEVESHLGRGSVFRVVLPAPAA